MFLIPPQKNFVGIHNMFLWRNKKKYQYFFIFAEKKKPLSRAMINVNVDSFLSFLHDNGRYMLIEIPGP